MWMIGASTATLRGQPALLRHVHDRADIRCPRAARELHCLAGRSCVHRMGIVTTRASALPRITGLRMEVRALWPAPP